jgi:hypothetical protein
MKRLTLAIFLSIFILPSFAFADVADQCIIDGGQANCECSSAEAVVSFPGQVVTSVNGCIAACSATFGEASYQYSVQCLTEPVTVGQGQVSSDPGEGTVDQTFDAPNLGVQIPGLEFGPAELVDGAIQSNYLGTYISALYNWAIGAAALVAIVMIMIAGLQWMLARGNSAGIGKAKNRIVGAVTGMILLLSAYTIAFLIDPNTTVFDSLSIQYIEEVDFPPDGEDLNIFPRTDISGETVPVEGNHIIGAGKMLNPEAAQGLTEASEEFFELTGKNIKLTSATRDLTKQAQLFYNNCLESGSNTCNPPTCNPGTSAVIGKDENGLWELKGELAGETSEGAIVSGLANNANVGNCPHTSTIAVDVWCEGSGGNFEYDPDCMLQLMQVMTDNGFCRLASEPWHFEWSSKKIARSCLTSPTKSYIRNGTTYVPPADCTKWMYKQNDCRYEQE